MNRTPTLVGILTLCSFIIITCQSPEYATDTETISKGSQLFSLYCKSCHSLEGDGIGPPVGGITRLLSRQKLIDFIQNPSEQIDQGDERANVLLQRYRLLMPSFEQLETADIQAILSYIHQETSTHDIRPLSLSLDSVSGLSGQLVPEVKPSGITLELEEFVQIDQVEGSSPDLGIVTLRAHPSDGSIYVSDQDGLIYRIADNKVKPFMDAREEIADFQSGPGIATGIGSFDFHPEYEQNGLFYVLHAETPKGLIPDYDMTTDSLQSEVQWVLSEWKQLDVKETTFRGTRRELIRFHAPTFAHGAQDLQFIPQLPPDHPEYGLLYFGFGDGGVNNVKRPDLCHELSSFLGTIMRIDPAGNNSRNGRYGIPDTNPFVDLSDSGIVREIYAYGFRNPHRMAWDPERDFRMLATDIGEANIEELNIIIAGGDYGWPAREGTYGNNTLKDKNVVFELAPSDVDLYKRPFAQYDHTEGQAISGGVVYQGDLELLRDKFIFGDIVTGKMYYTRMDSELSDSTVYELGVSFRGKPTDFKKLSGTTRLHLRVCYDEFAQQLYIITKVDGKIYQVTGAMADPS